MSMSDSKPVFYGVKFAWGTDCVLPEPPQGFSWKVAEKCPVEAVRDDGTEWRLALEPVRLVKVLWREPERHVTKLDFDNPINL